VLLWYALGPALARRWAWGLAALFAMSGVLMRERWSGNAEFAFDHTVHVAARILVPAIACLVVVPLLQRLLPAGPADETGSDKPIPRKGPRLVLALTWSVLMLIVGSGIGTVLVASSTMREMPPYFGALFLSATKAAYADAQFREGKYESAKGALEDFARFLESQKPHEEGKPWEPSESALDAKALAFDRMSTYARLAVNAERAQHADEASGWWTRAEAEARLLDWKEPTRDAIRNRIGPFLTDSKKPRPIASRPSSDEAR
jgi:hypothetical protein